VIGSHFFAPPPPPGLTALEPRPKMPLSGEGVYLMKKLLFAGAIACAARLINASAQAESLCQFWGPSLYDGDTVTDYWKVMLGSVPREAIPGRSDRTWCMINFAGGGGRRGLRGNFVSYEVLEAPKNGQFHPFPTNIRYKGMKVGSDRLVLKKHWLSSINNQPMSGTQIIEIEVVDQAL
jgi:hypothetical protein